MGHCFIHASTISSESLKHLCITTFSKFPRDSHVRIVAPNLITLQLDGFEGLTPSLGHMQSLIEAYVGLSSDCGDFCSINGQGCEDQHCACHAYPAGEGVLLNGLSSAASLELIGNTKTFIYRWDLKWCPIFEKLKTLLLNEWFRAIDLVCILQHSPILEMLTLQLGNTENLVGATGAEESMEQSFVCAHLNAAEDVSVDRAIDTFSDGFQRESCIEELGPLAAVLVMTWKMADRYCLMVFRGNSGAAENRAERAKTEMTVAPDGRVIATADAWNRSSTPLGMDHLRNPPQPVP
nr:uncharacterized protein LOC127309783 [Lolium perenne]